MIDTEIYSHIQYLIVQLRNARDVKTNFQAFQTFIAQYQRDILETTDLRWLVSICDTYADHGTPVERRNALLVSLFANLIRLSDTIIKTLEQTPNETMIAMMKSCQLPLFDGLLTLHLDKQDTCLNLAKRLTRLLSETPFFLAVYQKVIQASLDNDSLLGKFARLSARPEFVFPENALEIADNYGII